MHRNPKKRPSSNPLISNAQHDELVLKAKKAIEMCIVEPTVLPSVQQLLREVKFISDLPKGERKAAHDQASSAMAPNYATKFANVGIFGSVWIDAKLDGTPVRVAINPNATSYKDAIEIYRGE